MRLLWVMAAVALIQLTQGLNTDAPGKAVRGVFNDFSAVTVTNGSNTDVVSWKIYLLDAPPESTSFPATAQPQVLAQATSNTPTASFTPDIAGTYRLMLEVTDGSSNIDRDIRCFAIPDARGFVHPPYQEQPEPLPVALASIITVDPRPVKPDEQNYGTNVRGWAGNGTTKQLAAFLKQYDDLPHQIVAASPFTASESGPPLYVVDLPTIGGTAVFSLPSSPRVGLVLRVAGYGAPEHAVRVQAQGGGSVGSAGAVRVLGEQCITLVHRGTNQWTVTQGQVPGPIHAVLSSWDSGAGLEARWLHKTGDRGVYLYDYLQRTSNVADAIGLALTDNPTAKALLLPARELPLTRQVGDFLGGDGLRSNVAFLGVSGATKFVRPTGSLFQAMFAFPQSAEQITWSGVAFHLEDTSIVGCKAIQAYDVRRWRVDNCAFVCDDVPTNQGNAIAIGMFGSTDCAVTRCYFNRGQCGFGGLGYGCNGVVFTNNTCENVHDFAVSAVTGPPEVTPLHVKNIVIANNTIRGINGSGAIFVGSDGGSSPADVVQGVVIANNTLIGGVEVGYAGVRTDIVFCSGIETSQISISGNMIADDDAGATQARYAIFVSTCDGFTSFRGLSIASNQIGSVGAGGGVQAIYVDPVFVDDLQIVNNICRGNRGIFVRNARSRTLIQGNQVFDATASALVIGANGVSLSGLCIYDNYLESQTLFQTALLLNGNTVGQNITARIYRNVFRATQAASLTYVPNGGVGNFRFVDNEIVAGAGGADAAFQAAVTFARDNENYP